jgi:hypothetical protein
MPRPVRTARTAQPPPSDVTLTRHHLNPSPLPWIREMLKIVAIGTSTLPPPIRILSRSIGGRFIFSQLFFFSKA